MHLSQALTRLHSSHEVEEEQFEPGIAHEHQAAEHRLHFWLSDVNVAAAYGITPVLELQASLPLRLAISEVNFIDSHHIILLLIHYMVKYKGMKGKIVTAFSCSVKVEQMCKHYGLEQETVQIGFKHIAGKMITEDVLLGGEESGGIATKGHIPERDGIWMGLILFEFMAKSGKSLEDLITEVYKIVGEFAFERIDLQIDNDTKLRIIKDCKAGKFTQFGKYTVERIETTDGFKFFFDADTWLMIRPSGTEPVLRTYAEASTQEKVFDILADAKATIL